MPTTASTTITWRATWSGRQTSEHQRDERANEPDHRRALVVAPDTSCPARRASSPASSARTGMSARPACVGGELVHHLEIERHEIVSPICTPMASEAAAVPQRITGLAARSAAGTARARARAASRTASDSRNEPPISRRSRRDPGRTRAAHGQRQQQRDRRSHHRRGAE